MTENAIVPDGVDIDRYLANLYDVGNAIAEDLFAVYKRIYDLPIVWYSDDNLSEPALEYCKKRRHFVVVLPYTTDRRVFLSRVFYDNKLGWLLPGGSIRCDHHELLQGRIQLIRVSGASCYCFGGVGVGGE